MDAAHHTGFTSSSITRCRVSSRSKSICHLTSSGARWSSCESDLSGIDYDEAPRGSGRRENLKHDLFVLTFDDGYGDFCSQAFPLLQDLHLPATVFITTAFIEDGTPCVLSTPPAGRPVPLSWDELAVLRTSGLDYPRSPHTYARGAAARWSRAYHRRAFTAGRPDATPAWSVRRGTSPIHARVGPRAPS